MKNNKLFDIFMFEREMESLSAQLTVGLCMCIDILAFKSE